MVLQRNGNRSAVLSYCQREMDTYQMINYCDGFLSHENINITSWSDDGEIMSLEHKKYPIYGIQFHPEAILTEYGIEIIKNFTKIIV